MSYIFMDESGQFTKRSNEPTFVLASFITNNPRNLTKKFRSWQRSKFPRVMRDQSEIKFSDEAIQKNLRIKTIAFIAKLNIKVHYVYLRSENIPLNYWEKNKLKSGELYTHVVEENLKIYASNASHEFRVLCDQRNLRGITRMMFYEMLTHDLISLLPSNTRIQIEMKDSTSNVNIQIADWIAGAIAAYYNNKSCGEIYFRLLQESFASSGKELFRP